jgi:hypothetical protein
VVGSPRTHAFPLGGSNPGGGREEPVMALKQVDAQRPRTSGEVPHDALKRIERRVQDILARRDAALRSRRVAERLKGPVK